MSRPRLNTPCVKCGGTEFYSHYDKHGHHRQCKFCAKMRKIRAAERLE
jgi:hypothetical protein